jgi:hypothetical protein
MVKSLAWVLLFLMPLVAFAQATENEKSFQSDFQFFQNGLSLSRFSNTDLDQYLDPRVGPEEFRIPLSRSPWAGNYYPMEDGGIAQRWQAPEGEEIHMNIARKLTKEDLKKMSPAQIERLSPAEKYDIMQGDYNFSLTQHELERRGPLRWVNGIRCAGILMPEPEQAVRVYNPDGIEIRFQPADLKALSGASYFYVEKYAQLGAPTQEGRAESPPNAAVFDLALRYYLAKKEKPFVIDAHKGKEIWNETVIGFKRELSNNRKLTDLDKVNFPKAASKVKVWFELETLGEIGIEESNGTTKAKVADGSLSGRVQGSYMLYLDSQGKSIGGTWVKGKLVRGVDFVWFVAGKGTDAEYTKGVGNPNLDFKVLRRLFKLSTPVLSCSKVFF